MDNTSTPSTPQTTATAPPNPITPTGAGVVVAIACLGFFITTLDTTVVNVALPAIGHQWNNQVSGLQWVVDAYTLVFAALLLSAGSVADRIGASRAFGTGLALFTVLSAVCGFAPNLGALIGARAVQGAAAAIMLPASLSLVRQAYTDAKGRARGIALWTAGGGVAIAAGPVVGGALTSGLGWRWIFFINLPFGLAALLGLLKAPRSRRGHSPVDLGGQLTIVVALAALVFAVINGGAHGYSSLGTLLALAAFVVFAAAFVTIENRQASPAVPLSLFRDRSVAVCTSTGFVLNFGFYGLIFTLTLYFQQLRGASPLTAGLMFVPMTAFTTVVNLGAGRLISRHGPRLPLITGILIQAVDLLALLTVGQHTSTPVVLALLVPLGIGGGLAVPPLTSAMLEAVDAERAGLASGILNSARQIGGAIGVAVFGALAAGGSGFIAGMHTSLLVAGLALLLAAAAVLALLPRHPQTAAS
ncbi:MFS transporter [Kitasatospora kifunensis]|uniref:DHA2 family methylenomycin A resistance protein-like MFS transporter n=1 Tax=Kitasatospora kifunensis TaxID=58351 RepID=A0A7W7QYG3_KITKI|nr:MFS transporter [Kitasatospora kifunensis]MBB4922131.1 DHA2 family methylenomycin A resistance protein-like MFS transporter [Kitasatospora kifunensis]